MSLRHAFRACDRKRKLNGSIQSLSFASAQVVELKDEDLMAIGVKKGHLRLIMSKLPKLSMSSLLLAST